MIGYRNADRSLSGDTIKIGRWQSISAIGGRLREKKERRKGRYLLFPAQSIDCERFFVGRLPSPHAGRRGEKGEGRTRRRLVSRRGNEAMPRLTAWERGNTSSPHVGRRENDTMARLPGLSSGRKVNRRGSGVSSGNSSSYRRGPQKRKGATSTASRVLQRQVFMPSVKRSPTSASTHQASERIIKCMLSKEGHQGQPYISASHPELQIQEINLKKDKRPPLPTNASLNVKDYISHNRSLASVSDGDSNSHAAACERSIGHRDRKSDMSFASRSEDMKIHRGGRVSLSSVENGEDLSLNCKLIECFCAFFFLMHD
ncbi:hypothetical protein GW17_00003825 [Ensete ventricosum]|nr:hypothetical protein GW17_00003825 [Ensete ventricosum]